MSSARRKTAGWASGRIELRIAYYKIDRCINTKKRNKKSKKKNEHGFLEPQVRFPLQEFDVPFRELILKKVSGV